MAVSSARFAVVVLAAMVAAACGGGEQQPVPPADAAGALPEPAPVESQPRPGAPSPEEGTATNQPRLGDRFELCADVQRIWDELAAVSAEYATARSAVADAAAVVDAATDELDRAEATEALHDAEYILGTVEARYQSAAHEAAGELGFARFKQSDGGTDSRSIVYGRAWDAFVAAAGDRTLAALSDADAAEAALESARRAHHDAEQAYEMAHRQALADAEAAAEEVDQTREAERWAAREAYAEEHDVHISETWNLYVVEAPDVQQARDAVYEHLKAVEAEATPELVALRATIQERWTATSDASEAINAATNARSAELEWNTATNTSAYLAFQDSLRQSCQ